MLRELLKVLRAGEPQRALGASFEKMVELASDLTAQAGKVYFGEEVDPEKLSEIRRQDVKINKLQRKIRKRVVTHVSVSNNAQDLPYCLLLMSLVKDVERIGDYAKELTLIHEYAPPLFPDHQTVSELQAVRVGAEELMANLEGALSSENGQAVKLIRQGRGLVDRGDELLRSLASLACDAPTHTALVLGTHYYKRICGHALNVLSSAVVPLHKLDYYDEDDIAVARATPP